MSVYALNRIHRQHFFVHRNYTNKYRNCTHMVCSLQMSWNFTGNESHQCIVISLTWNTDKPRIFLWIRSNEVVQLYFVLMKIWSGTQPFSNFGENWQISMVQSGEVERLSVVSQFYTRQTPVVLAANMFRIIQTKRMSQSRIYTRVCCRANPYHQILRWNVPYIIYIPYPGWIWYAMLVFSDISLETPFQSASN